MRKGSGATPHPPAPAEAACVACDACGAPAPLLGGPTARCLYCLADVHLPPWAHRPIDAHARLRAELETSVREIAQARATAAAQQDFLAKHIGWTVLVAGASALGAAALAVAADDWGVIATGAASLIFFASLAVAVVAASRSARRNELRRLAALPPLAFRIGSALVPICPRCGAPASIPHAGAITTTCAACRTAALLPAPLVEQALLTRHKAVIDARKRGDIARRAGGDFATALHRWMGYGFLITAVVGAIGIPACGYYGASPYMRNHVSWVGLLWSGVFWGGLFGFFSYQSFRTKPSRDAGR